MVRLTAEMIADAPQYINTIRDRELNLRGFKIPVIENMGVTRDTFDVIDFTDNDVKRLDNFPLLKRLNTLYMHNNRVHWIQSDIGEKLPNLKSLTLTNNNLCELGDIDALAGCKKLEYLTLIGNPLVHKQNYRSYVIFKLPTVRVIDFKRVRLAEREAARRIFKGKRGQKARDAIRHSTLGKDSELGVDKENEGMDSTPMDGTTALSQEDKLKIQDAIQCAKSLQEVEYLQQILSSGRVPEKGWNRQMDLVHGEEDVPADQFVPEVEMDTGDSAEEPAVEDNAQPETEEAEEKEAEEGGNEEEQAEEAMEAEESQE